MVTASVVRAATIIIAAIAGSLHGRSFQCVGSGLFLHGLMTGFCGSTWRRLIAAGVHSGKHDTYRCDGQAGRQQQIQEYPES